MYNDNTVDQAALLAEIQKLTQSMKTQDPDADARKTEPITVNIGGQDYTFKDQEELSANMSKAFTALNEQNAILMAQLEERLKEQQTKASNDDDSPKVDFDRFAELMKKNPAEAFDYVDSIRYGEHKAPPIVSQLQEQLQETQRQLNVYAFLNSHPEYQNNDNNAAILKQVMDGLGLQPDIRGLEIAYKTAQAYQLPLQLNNGDNSQGRFAQNPQQSTPQFTQNYGPQSTGINAPPPVSRGGQQLPSNDIEAHLESLSMEQLAKLIQGQV